MFLFVLNQALSLRRTLLLLPELNLAVIVTQSVPLSGFAYQPLEPWSPKVVPAEDIISVIKRLVNDEPPNTSITCVAA